MMNGRKNSEAEKSAPIRAQDAELPVDAGNREKAAPRGGVVRRIVDRCLAISWYVNAVLLLSAFAWIYWDARSRRIIELSREWVTGTPAVLSEIGERVRNGPFIGIISAGVLIAGISLALMLLGLFLGGQRFRSMRRWMLFMALVAGWLGLAVSWPEVYWLGQLHRFKPTLAAAEAMVHRLQADWPEEDGDLPEIGPFLAYPKGAPTTILPLRWITFPQSELRFSAIERTKDGALRFELAGDEAGAWLEWRPNDEKPEPFLSGLDTAYHVTRQQKIAPHWFLVRYRTSAGGSIL